MISKLKSLGFTAGHAHLLLVAVALFSVLIVAKSGINYRTMFASAESTKPQTLSYEDALSQAQADNAQPTEQSTAEDDAQIALLDRSLDSGQVLGDSIGIGTVPSAEQIFSREKLDQIKLNTVPTDSKSIQMYSDNLIGVESQNDASTLIGNLNSSDPDVLKQTKQQADATVQKLSALIVPTELADYNRYQMIYYEALSNMAQGFATNTLDTDFQNTSKIFFSVTNKIEQTKSDIQQKYQVSL